MSGEWSLSVLPPALPGPTPLPFPLHEHPDGCHHEHPPSLHWVLPLPPLPQLCKHPFPAGTGDEGKGASCSSSQLSL